MANREEERVHLLPSIVVTALVFQVDTSELNADALLNTARREKGVTKNRKTKPHHTNNNNNVPFQTTNKKRNTSCETCDPMKLELSYIKKYNNRSVATEREGERVHLLLCIVVTAPVFHLDTS